MFQAPSRCHFSRCICVPLQREKHARLDSIGISIVMVETFQIYLTNQVKKGIGDREPAGQLFETFLIPSEYWVSSPGLYCQFFPLGMENRENNLPASEAVTGSWRGPKPWGGGRAGSLEAPVGPSAARAGRGNVLRHLSVYEFVPKAKPKKGFPDDDG